MRALDAGRRPEDSISANTPTAGPPRSRRRRDLAVVVGCVAVVVAALAWAATRSDDAGGDVRGAVTDPTRTATTPAELVLGDTFDDRGVETTVLLSQSFGPPTPTGPDSSWYGFRVRRCADPDALAAAADASWEVWSVSDGTTSYDAVDLTPPDGLVDQVLPTSGVRADECEVGWVFLDVPTGVARDVRQVALRQDGSVAAEWAVD